MGLRLATLLFLSLLVAGCGPQEASRLEVTSGAPQNPVQIDEGSAQEESIDMGVDLESGLEVHRFRAEVMAAIGDLDDQFGDRLILDSFVDQKTEYVIFVAEIADSDQAWLDSISAGGLGGTIAIEADPDLHPPSGPCLDEATRARGETRLFASTGQDAIEASLGHINVNGCPGSDRDERNGLHGDGFFASLDRAVLHIEPGELITLEATGLRSPRLETGLDVVGEVRTAVGYEWEVVAPNTLGTHEIDLHTFWEEGDALYRIRLVVE